MGGDTIHTDYPTRHVKLKKNTNNVIDFSDERIETLSYKDSDFWKEIESDTEYILEESVYRFPVATLEGWNLGMVRQMEGEIGCFIRQDEQSRRRAAYERDALARVYQINDSYAKTVVDAIDERIAEEFANFCKEIDCRIENEVIGTFAGNGVEIMGKTPVFVTEFAGEKFFGTTKIETKDICNILQSEPERYKSHRCHVSEGKCEIWVDAKTGMLEGFYPLLPNMERKAVLKDSQRDYLKKYIRKIDKIVKKQNANCLLHKMAVLIQKRGMAASGNRRNYLGKELYMIYMNIYFRTLGLEEAAKELVEMRNDLLSQSLKTIGNKKVREKIEKEQAILSFEEQVAEKMDIKGISREEALWEIHRRYH